MDIIVNKVATKLEYEQILNIRKEVFIKEQKVPASLEIDEYENDAEYFYAKVDNKIISTGRIRKVDNQVKFERIATLKKYRGKGVGKSLMVFMQDYAIQKYSGLSLIMYAQESAVSFYKKIGWVVDGEMFVEANINHQKMIFNQ